MPIQIRKRPSRRRLSAALATCCLATAVAASACTGEANPSSQGATPASAQQRSGTIPQPPLSKNLAVAPESQRVDVAMPKFTHPTQVTNPLYPISSQHSVLFVGHVDGKPFRTEVTLLPETTIVQWGGQDIEALVSQYVAYLDGRITEVAFDKYVQADDGSVWYLGEDVSDFARGVIVTKEGTWLAGKDGPGAMIMPADPQVGDVWRTENIPGIAFEEVSVKKTDKTLNGPLGPVDGGLIAGELHMDASSENKTFAPEYGEFLTSGAGDVEALALAVPTDALSGPEPSELLAIKSGASHLLDAVQRGEWTAATASLRRMATAWLHYPSDAVPRRLAPRMAAAIKELTRVVRARLSVGASQAAIDVTQWALDLELLYNAVPAVDLQRLALWATRLQVDAGNRDAASMRGDFFTIDLIRDRVLGVLDTVEVNKLNLGLAALEAAVLDRNFARASRAAEKLRATVSGIDVAA